MSSSYCGIGTTAKGEEKSPNISEDGFDLWHFGHRAFPKNNFNCRFSDSDPDTARRAPGRGMTLPVFHLADASTNKAQFK